MSDDPHHTPGHPSRPPLSNAAGPSALVAACAERFGVLPGQLLLSVDAEPLVALVVRTFITSGDRVAVFEPCLAGHLEAVLASEGKYVDCGRDIDWKPRLDSLDFVLGDGAAGVILARPNAPVDGGNDTRVMASLAELGDFHSARFVMVDRRFAPKGTLPGPDDGILTLLPVELRSGGFVFALVGPSEAMDALLRARVGGSGLAEDVELADAGGPEEDGDLEAMGDRLSAVGFSSVLSPGVGAWVQEVGVPSEVLAERVQKAGFEIRARHHHTWRGGVWIPSPGAHERGDLG